MAFGWSDTSLVIFNSRRRAPSYISTQYTESDIKHIAANGNYVFLLLRDDIITRIPYGIIGTPVNSTTSFYGAQKLHATGSYLFIAKDTHVWTMDLNMNVASARYYLIGSYGAFVSMLQSTENSVLLITLQNSRISAVNVTADARIMYINAVATTFPGMGYLRTATSLSTNGNQTCAVSLYHISYSASAVWADSVNLDFSIRHLAIVILPSSFTGLLLLLTLWKLSRYTDESELADWGGFLVILSMFCPLVKVAGYPLWLKMKREDYFDGKRNFAAHVLVALSMVNVAFYMMSLLRNVILIFQPDMADQFIILSINSVVPPLMLMVIMPLTPTQPRLTQRNLRWKAAICLLIAALEPFSIYYSFQLVRQGYCIFNEHRVKKFGYIELFLFNIGLQAFFFLLNEPSVYLLFPSIGIMVAFFPFGFFRLLLSFDYKLCCDEGRRRSKEVYVAETPKRQADSKISSVMGESFQVESYRPRVSVDIPNEVSYKPELVNDDPPSSPRENRELVHSYHAKRQSITGKGNFVPDI